MFGWGPATRTYLAAGATDMRQGFEGLYGLARDQLLCDPLSGHVFLFSHAQRNRLKLLFWDGAGYGNIKLPKELPWAYLKIQVLEERLRLQRIQKYGPGSEKLSSAQLELLELEPGVSTVEVQAKSKRGLLPEPAPREARRKHPGRQDLPAELPRVERVIACAPEQCTGAASALAPGDVPDISPLKK